MERDCVTNMTYKVKKNGKQILLDTESLCMHCDGCGLVHNKMCKNCNGHGILATYQNNGFYNTVAYAPTKNQVTVREKLGGTA